MNADKVVEDKVIEERGGELFPPEITGNPDIYLSEAVHCCGENNNCIAAMITGIPLDYEHTGRVIMHLLLPIPTSYATCHKEMVRYHKPKNQEDKPKRTWHTVMDCHEVGGCKRMNTSNLIM